MEMCKLQNNVQILVNLGRFLNKEKKISCTGKLEASVGFRLERINVGNMKMFAL